MEAYLAQPIDEDSVNLITVEATIDGLDFVGSLDNAMSNPNVFHEKPPSIVTSLGSSVSSIGSGASGSSFGSGSNASSLSRTRRQGRRTNWRRSPYGDPMIENPAEQHFFYTFDCGETFRSRCDWSRHEGSVHANQKSWICCQEPSRPLPVSYCLFCRHDKPDDAHMQEHNFQKCNENPEEKRTFYRKDNFAQHLHNAHFRNATHPINEHCRKTCSKNGQGSNYGCVYLIVKWHRYDASKQYDPSLNRCGFCGTCLDDWGDRCKHVSRHFTSPKKVTQAEWRTSRLPAPVPDTGLSLPGATRWGETWKLLSCRFLRSRN
ncbi:hypothetical protein BCR34DRAFT_126642 [Clohesyomyces aquaticus]|uniref:C2H2-type domain-containing protein n=1 Tax=Clohesyomyces aquaticus TaxID=1231657 RepID=A0A1Y1YN87_9PLEO|nr:hypothetical protein BCR34DRAFT_126642 [Clohesyomyces aquaticus]